MLILIDNLIGVAFAWPGLGSLVWSYNQTVNLDCAPALETCETKSAAAYFTYDPSSLLSSILNPENKDLTRGVITFCPVYFDYIPTFDAVATKTNANENSEQLNVLSMKSQGKISSPTVIYCLL
jgi:hypothetical protein